ncbi:unnamed protein product, partial [Nippostrongylus brasiliensis]|uniref:Neur_chan_LBD domain-containing protein n=1 Tax=Nippostrongylus brasiliensis TaxID=27835 RepID=A0A0N4XIY1_NIPBR
MRRYALSMISGVVLFFTYLTSMGNIARADSVTALLSNTSTLISNRSAVMEDIPLVRLTRDLLARDKYDVRVRPIIDHTKPLKVHISISLYQIIEV